MPSPKDDQELEYKIQEKGLNAPRLTPAHIDSVIKNINYYIVPNTNITICVLELMNGFVLTGESISVSKENFNEQIGREVAYNNARDKIWQLEGYLLKQKLFERDQIERK